MKDEVEMIENEGMPVFGGDGHGKLYVTYKLVLPSAVDDEFVDDLAMVFEGRRNRIVGSKHDEL